MNRSEALSFMKKNKNKILKLDWWNSNMYIYWDGKKYLSGGGGIVKINFLLEGNFIESKQDDRLLGGLFAL